MFNKSKYTSLTGLLELSVVNLFFIFSRIKLLQNRSDFTILKKGSNLTEYGTERTRSKTRKTRKFFSKIFKSEFSILAVGQNQKLGNKKTRNNISEISEVSEFSICHFSFSFLFFFFFYKCFFRIFFLHL